MKSGYRFTLVLSVCLLLLAPIVVAQTTGTIDGTVTDQNGGALPGATVEITSPNLQGTRTATTGNDGRFRFVSVPPGQYKVTANLSGMGTAAKNATVQLDSTATVNLQMQVSAREAITVTGEAPLVDTASTTTGTSYTAKVMDKLPLGRNYASIALSQPGVQTDSGETQGRSLALSVYGATSAENLFLIDGVNTTNVIKGFQGKAINGEFIQEVEVKTGGYQAEYGRNTGGVINVVTKSGGNEFHGDLFGYYNPPSFTARPRQDVTPDESQTGDASTNTAGSHTINVSADHRGASRRGIPAEADLEPVGRQADVQRGPGDDHRGHDFRRPAGQHGRAERSDQLQPLKLQRPARRRRHGLGGPVQPALRLLRDPDRAVQPAQGPLPDETGRARRAASEGHDRFAGPHYRRFRLGLRPDHQQRLAARPLLGQLHRLHREQRVPRRPVRLL